MQKDVTSVVTPVEYQTGSWVGVQVGGVPVAVKGAFVNGVFRIATATMRSF